MCRVIKDLLESYPLPWRMLLALSKRYVICKIPVCLLHFLLWELHSLMLLLTRLLTESFSFKFRTWRSTMWWVSFWYLASFLWCYFMLILSFISLALPSGLCMKLFRLDSAWRDIWLALLCYSYCYSHVLF